MGQKSDFGRDDAFTVVEVVVAAAVMFFVLTAIVGLLGASSSMTVQAKQRSVMTNAVATYLDGLRTAEWEDVAQPSGPITFAVNGITITMNVNVETRQEEGQDIVKVIRVQAVSTLNGKSQMYETSVALLRNPNFNRTLKTDPDAPVVYFMPEAPDDDEVIWGAQHDEGAIFLRTKAFSPKDKVKAVFYDVTGRSVTTTFAEFYPDPMVQMYYSAPTLNTTSEGIGDGFQQISVTAVDEYNRAGLARRRVIVDNQAPDSEPTSVTAEAADASMLTISWKPATDGGARDTTGTVVAPNYASHYQCVVSVEPTQGQSLSTPNRVILNEPRWLSGSNLSDASTDANPVIYEATVADGTKNVEERAVPPFSRFEIEVQASSPRNLTTGVWVEPVRRVFTRPELFCDAVPSIHRSSCITNVWGSGADKGSQYTLDLWLSRAAFRRGTDSPKWEVEYQSAATTPTPGGWLPFDSAPQLMDYDGYALRLKSVKKFIAWTDGRPLWFRVRMSGYNASRDGGAAVPAMYTNAIGPSKYMSPEVPVYLAKTWSY